MIIVKIIVFMLLWILIGLIICLTLDIIFSVEISNKLFRILVFPLYLLMVYLPKITKYLNNIRRIFI